MTTITIKVPATTANIGSGFDCLGAALTLYNYFKFTPIDSTSETTDLQIEVIGEEAHRLSKDKSNLLYQSFAKFYEKINQPIPSVAIKIVNEANPTMTYGRQFDATNLLYSTWTRQSIDALKENFKDALENEDWRLVVKLKKVFNIL